MRTFAERSKLSTAIASAISAPFARALSTTRAASATNRSTVSRFIASPDLRPAHGDPGDAGRGAADADGHRLPLFAARPDAVGELDVGAEHVDLAEHIGAVADQVHAFERRRDLPVLDQIALGEREDEVAVADVDLPTGELLGVHTALHARDDLLVRVRAAQHHRVRHARHRSAAEALSPAVGAHGVEVLRALPVLHVPEQLPVLDQRHRVCFAALVVDVDAAAPVRVRRIVDDGDQLARYELPD